MGNQDLSTPTNMPTTKKMTAKEVKALQPYLGRMSLDTVKMARRVLVEGTPQSEIVKETGLSKQRVSGMVNRFLAVARGIPKGWEHVDVWLPPDLAEQV